MKGISLIIFLALFSLKGKAGGDTLITQSGLKYLQLKPGNGKKPYAGATVKVHYKGMFLNGKVFESSYDEGTAFKFKLGAKEVIPGWDEGFLLMTEGEKALLIIPAELAYGKKGVKDEDNPKKYLVPPDTPLMFEVELLKVK